MPAGPQPTMLESQQSYPPSLLSRAEFHRRHPGYRTPSPPRHSIEPFSPADFRFNNPSLGTDGTPSRKRTYDHAEQHGMDGTSDWPAQNSKHPTWQDYTHAPQQGPTAIDTRKASQPDSSALDFLATIATSPSLAPADPQSSFRYPQPSSTFVHGHQFSKPQPYERASKRSRSEVINYRPIVSSDSRPSTSYAYPSAFSSSSQYNAQPHHGSTSYVSSSLDHSRQTQQSAEDDVREDAELLLSISRGFPSFASHNRSVSDQTAFLGNGDHDNTDQERVDTDRFAKTSKTRAKESRKSWGGAEHSMDNTLTTPIETGSLQDGTLPAHAMNSTTTTTTTQGHSTTKPKDHRGWPKGKPRGPRNTEGKKRSKTVKKGDGQTAEKPSGRSKTKTQQQKRSPGTASTSPVDWYSMFDVPGNIRRPRRKSYTLNRYDPDFGSLDEHRRGRQTSAPPAMTLARESPGNAGMRRPKLKREQPADVCKSCNQNRNANRGLHEHWINCNGCKSWFHIQCAGFEDEKRLKEVDKYYCEECEPEHGSTTFVRKSSRAHASVDYAGLHEGKIRTAVDVPDHHYIEPIKKGLIEFQPETFARLPPELVTREYFERCGSWTEPVLIPAAFNPRPKPPFKEQSSPDILQTADVDDEQRPGDFAPELDYDCVPDDSQDSMDMVIPHGLTVRRAAELYGPEEKVDVIDVKLQEGEDRRWSMRQWADYYEAEGAKPVRNVISLEVSQSLLGKLIRRPKVVRDLDLQDSVWPEEETAKGVFPRVQFYCLMSVADCYTDFHIDFGGSSVYYHILKGRKTFFFIPPKPKYLKKYEDWCNSPDQNSVFLGNETKECYRVDLYPGDTMLIPSGWIHAVWTPENSLVIGGNFLTRMHYGTQITVNDIEKATNVTRKFRYPYFQKILWLTLVRYLEDDPVPSTVVNLLCEGRQFERKPVYDARPEDEDDLEQAAVQPELYNARYYSQAELDGLPDLIRYIYRTVMISLGKLPGISKSTQDAVVKSMPKDCGDHLEILRIFAMWAAWKRGNENIPSWAYPDAPLPDIDAGAADKKLSAAAQKKMDRQAMQDALNAAGARRTSLRAPKAAESSPPATTLPAGSPSGNGTPKETTKGFKSIDSRRLACDSCRKSKRRCTHNDALHTEDHPSSPAGATVLPTTSRFGVKMVQRVKQPEPDPATPVKREPLADSSLSSAPPIGPQLVGVMVPSPPDTRLDAPVAKKSVDSALPAVNPPEVPSITYSTANGARNNVVQQKPKNRACEACRRSKHRCTHNLGLPISSTMNFANPAPKRPSEGAISEQYAWKKVKRDSDSSQEGMNTSFTTNGGSAPVRPFWPARADHLAMQGFSAPAAPMATMAPPTINGIAPTLHATTQNLQQPYQHHPQYNQPAARVPLNSVSSASPYQYQPLPNAAPPKNTQPGLDVAQDAQTIISNGLPNTEQTRVETTDPTTRTSSNSMPDSRSRTSSVHHQGSRSPPTSPLTEPEPSSPVPAHLATPAQTIEQPSPGKEATPQPAKQAVSAASPVVCRSGSAKARRASTASSAGKPNGVRKSSVGSRRGSHGSPVSVRAGSMVNGAGSPKPTVGSSPVREKTQTEIDEEESVKVAKELAAAEAGLRRRGVVRYTR